MSTAYTHERLRPAEWVFPGHPDKLADAIADRLVELGTRNGTPACLTAVEVAIHRNRVYLTGRSTLGAIPGFEELQGLRPYVQEVIESAGYKEDAWWRPHGSEFILDGNLCLDKFHDGEVGTRHLSDDQCIITGYAIDSPGTYYMPPEHWFARQLAQTLLCDPYLENRLCPDGKVLIKLRQTGSGLNASYELDSVSTSLLVTDDVTDVVLRRKFLECLEETLGDANHTFLCSKRMPDKDRIVVNGSGNFYIGGPEGDNGLSGKKLLLDYYGPRVPIGGGAMCGKDLEKPDRAGAYIARALALKLVDGGVADEVLVTGTVLPGSEYFEVSSIQTPKGWLRNPRQYESLVDTRIASVYPHVSFESLVFGSRWGYWYDCLNLLVGQP